MEQSPAISAEASLDQLTLAGLMVNRRHSVSTLEACNASWGKFSYKYLEHYLTHSRTSANTGWMNVSFLCSQSSKRKLNKIQIPFCGPYGSYKMAHFLQLTSHLILLAITTSPLWCSFSLLDSFSVYLLSSFLWFGIYHESGISEKVFSVAYLLEPSFHHYPLS